MRIQFIQRYFSSILPVALVLVMVWLSGCETKNDQSEGQKDTTVDSVGMLTRAIMEDSTQANLFLSRARVYLKNGNIDPALRDLNQAIQLQPNNPYSYQMLSDIYLILDQTDNSIASLKKAIKLNPDLVASYLKLAEVYLITGNPNAANQAADEAIRIDRNHAESYYIKGISLLESGDTANSILNLQISVRLDTINFMSYMQLAAISIAQADTLTAYYLTQALKIQPKEERALFFLAMTYQEQRKFQDAIDKFKLVTEYYPNNKRAFYHLGYIYLAELSDYGSAKIEFQKAIELDPNYVEAVYNLGRTFEALKEYKTARSYYKQSLELLPNYPLAVQGMNRLDDNGLGL
ncbi:MAG: tetratricopeptide repeat protein [Bacteroidales bacterium]|jgi:tetratricopeptide (TPR) repeat protein